jgi:hypothetical protein
MLLAIPTETIAALGAFLSGAGSVIGAIFVLRSMRKRMEKECAERLRLFKEGMSARNHLDDP